MKIFKSYTREDLDREYNNRAKVAESAAIAERWTEESAAVRRQFSCDLDIAYGPEERQKLDIFPVERRDAPVLAFIHGGYWHSRDKSFVHFLAPTFLAAGVTFISIGYRLCPAVGMPDVVADVRRGVEWVSENARAFGGDPARIHLAGHSAGGHLAALLGGPAGLAEGLIQGLCSISGLHDLEPIRLCYLNDQLGLDAETAHALSPVRQIERMAPRRTPLPPHILTVGGAEGPEYLRQRDELAAALRAKKQPVETVDLPGRNHFTALEAFADPHHPLCQAVLRLILAPRF